MCLKIRYIFLNCIFAALPDAGMIGAIVKCLLEDLVLGSHD